MRSERVWRVGRRGVERDPAAYRNLVERAARIGAIAGPHAVYELLGPEAAREDQEVAWILMLDTHGFLRGEPQEIARGARDRVAVEIPDALRAAVIAGSRYIVLCHNHPSGHATPSDADGELTMALAQAADLCDLLVLDHVVLGMGEFFSFREGRLWTVK